MTDDDELRERERELLAAYRDHHAMPAERRDRVWASLVAGVPPGGGGSALESASEPWVAAPSLAAKTSARPALIAGLLVAAGITLVVLGLAGSQGDPAPELALAPESASATNRSELQPEPFVEVAAPKLAAPNLAAPKLAAPPEPTPKLAAPPEPTPKLAAPPEPTPKPRARKPIVTPSPSLGRERELIEQAHAALAKGDTATALARLDEHARDYAEGVFAEEREALDAIVRCKAGELEAGRASAARFLARHPQAVLGARVRRACNLEGSASEVP